MNFGIKTEQPGKIKLYDLGSGKWAIDDGGDLWTRAWSGEWIVFVQDGSPEVVSSIDEDDEMTVTPIAPGTEIWLEV